MIIISPNQQLDIDTILAHLKAKPSSVSHRCAWKKPLSERLQNFTLRLLASKQPGYRGTEQYRKKLRQQLDNMTSKKLVELLRPYMDDSDPGKASRSPRILASSNQRQTNQGK